MLKRLNRRDTIFSVYFGIITALLVFFSISCGILEREGNIIWDGKHLMLICGISFACAVVAFFVSCLVISLIKRREEDSKKGNDGEKKNLMAISDPQRKLPKWVWLGYVAIIGCWIPVFLAFYPGLCNYDAEGYFYQFVFGPYNNHHPICYTLIVRLFYYLGSNIFGSYYVGIAIFTAVQMLLLGISIFYFICTVYSFFPKKRLFIFLTVLFAIYPFNSYMSVTMTKDIFFAAGMICSFTAFIRIMLKRDNTIKPEVHDFINIIGMIFIVLFRSNGRYCVLAMIFVELLFLIFNKTRRKTILKLLSITLIALVIGMFTVKVVDKITDAQQVDKREMLSVPGQQIARVVHFHEDELDEETMNAITTVIWPSSLYLYNQRTARFVKQDIISYEVKHYPKKYLKLYLDLLKEYPGDYVNAVMGMYSGFLSPFDTSHVLINEDDGVLEDGFHYIQTAFTVTDRFGISQQPISNFLYKLYTGYSNEDGYLKIPILAFLFVPGTFLWVWLYSFGILIYQKKNSMLLPFTIVFTYYLTFFLGPTVQLRYIFPIMLCTPGLILLTLYKRAQ